MYYAIVGGGSKTAATRRCRFEKNVDNVLWRTSIMFCANVLVFKTVVREFGIYLMRNFIIQPNSKGVRTTSHKFKLSFYIKTSVSVLSIDTFQLNPFRFVSFTEIEAIDIVNLNILLDCIGHVVGKEDARPMIIKSSQESKCMPLYLKDLEKNKIKCTIFGEMIGKLTPFINKDDGEPLVLVAQLFKPNQYLNQINVQNSFYASRMFLNLIFLMLLHSRIGM
ncbi:hypothetical protein AHAS_Ahas02G0089200 [Arachis hypogaea]